MLEVAPNCSIEISVSQPMRERQRRWSSWLTVDAERNAAVRSTRGRDGGHAMVVRADLAAIRLPIPVIHGDLDRSVPVAVAAERTTRAPSAGRARCVHLPAAAAHSDILDFIQTTNRGNP